MVAEFRPLLLSDEDHCDTATGKVLMIANVLICGKEDVEACIFGSLDEISVLQAVPTLLRSGCYLAVSEKKA
jgi:hypothetical protein